MRNITSIQTKEYKNKILGEGDTEEGALAINIKDALDLYMKQGNNLNCMDVDLKSWQRALREGCQIGNRSNLGHCPTRREGGPKE